MTAALGTPTMSTSVGSMDDWIATATRYLFFTGKGGVGKTTVASAIALGLAELGRRTLIVSTDPASNLDEVFAMQAGNEPTPVPALATLWVMNLDPVAAAAAYRERTIAPHRKALPAAALRSMEEQLSGACTVEIAAFNEFTGLLADAAQAERFDHIVFDTAPTGHTLRLLSLPSAWSGFIDTNTSGTSCLGPLAGLEPQRAQYAAAVVALADPASTTLMLVARPDEGALREAARAAAELATLGIRNQRLVINGVLPDDGGEDRVARAFAMRQAHALLSVPDALASLPRLSIPLVDSGLTGLAALRSLRIREREAGTGIGMPTRHASPAGAAPPPGGFFDLHELVKRIEQDGRGVIMTMGKGGVGKTTLAASIARSLANAGHRVHLSTTDPAAHVAQAIGRDVPATLIVSRIDPAAEVTRYTDEVLQGAEDATAGLEPEERALLEEDLRSPCTEEIAVFRAFARTVADAANGFVVLDTAPTGHTLLLLDAAESYHREVARTTGSHIPEAVRALLPRLRDPRYTKMLLVTLPESTPVHEAERLQADLRRAGIEPFGWVVNASLAASGTTHPLLAARARLEAPLLARVRDTLLHQACLVPWRADSS